MSTQLQGSVMVVDDEESIQKLIGVALTRAGYEVTTASDGREAMQRVAEAIPDLIISDVMMPHLDGFELVRRLRAEPATSAIPVVLLTARRSMEDVVAGLELGADDYLPKPFQMGELMARVHAKVERPPLPKSELSRDRQTGLLSERRFFEEMERELARVTRGGSPGCLACLDLDELPRLRERLGSRAEAEIARQTAALIGAEAGPLELAGHDAGGFVLLLPEMSPEAAHQRLEQLSRRIAAQPFAAGGETVRLTPTIGYTAFGPGAAVEQVDQQALLALDEAALQLDLHPVRYRAAMEPPAGGMAGKSSRATRPWSGIVRALREPLQIALTGVVALVIPFMIYVLLGAMGLDPTPPVYLFIVLAMLGTAILIATEGFLSLRRIDPPAEPGAPYPPASAIIAALLPNEAATIVETVEAFLRIDYPADLQIILAYNTPRDLPIEAVLQEIARRDPRFLPLRVEGSTSKAQNVNAALPEVRGEFVAIFDADHHPDPDSFTRAWRWLSNGYDVVQGHCLVRNGDASWVARLVAIEFESFYTVGHPGRARLHGFGIFGGSNGYWKTERLRQTRMRGWMLTEDIDSSMRVVADGGKIVCDPGLISRELAPVTLKGLWNQRMRWAQGWLQVSYRHMKPSLRSPHLSARQKLGLTHLLGWREIYPWLSLQIIPILAYKLWWRGDEINWFRPFFLFTTLVMLSNGPAQILFTYRQAAPEIRRRKSWFVFYYVVSCLFYMEFKNVIARTAHLKEAMRERDWKVTPRTQAKEV